MMTFDEFIKTVSKEQLNHLYNIALYTQQDICDQFNITTHSLQKALKLYKITKEQSAHTQAIKEAKKNHFGYENYNGHKDFVFELSKEAELAICQQYLKGYSIRQLNHTYHTHKTELVLAKYSIPLRTKEENAQLKSTKIKNTCLERYGVENAAKTEENRAKIKNTWASKSAEELYEIKQKSWKKYVFDDLYFDSSWELCYYIWCKDHNIDILQPKITLTYEADGKLHKYLPDFLVNGRLVEIKSDYLFEQMQIPETLDSAKYECMLKNNVQILMHDDVKEMVDYVKEQYGISYIEQFKVSG